MTPYVYGISIAQFLLGALITVINLILWISVAVSPRLRTAPYYLMGNMWFVNLLLGIIVAVSNVVDQSEVYVFQKTEGTVAIVNGFVTIFMLLALVTNRVVTVRNPTNAMSPRTAFKIIVCTWSIILALTLMKAVVFGLYKLGKNGACFDCFLTFEVTSLVILTVVTLIIFFVSVYFVCTHRNRTVGDSNSVSSGYQKEYRMTLTVGLLLFGFSLTFLSFVFLIAAWLADRDQLDLASTEIVITLFYTHCIINPIIAFTRDPELRAAAKLVCKCQRPANSSSNNELQPAVPLTAATALGRPAQLQAGPDHFAMSSPQQQPVQMQRPPMQPPEYPYERPPPTYSRTELPPIERPSPRGEPMVEHINGNRSSPPTAPAAGEGGYLSG